MNSTAQITNRIEREVIGRKAVAKLGMNLLPAIAEHIKPFIGKKVCKVDGSHTKAFKEHLKAIIPNIHSDNKTVYVSQSGGGIFLYIKIWYKFGDYTTSDGSYSHSDGQYYEQSVYFGRVDSDNELEEVYINTENYSKELFNSYKKIRKTLDKIKQLEENIKELKKTIPYYSYR